MKGIRGMGSVGVGTHKRHPLLPLGDMGGPVKTLRLKEF